MICQDCGKYRATTYRTDPAGLRGALCPYCAEALTNADPDGDDRNAKTAATLPNGRGVEVRD